MKKRVLLLCLMVVALTFSACGGPTEENKTEKAETSSQQESQKNDVELNANDSFELFSYTSDIDGVNYVVSATSKTPVAGTVVTWNAVMEDMAHGIAPMLEDEHPDYDNQVFDVMTYTLTQADEQNGVIIWLNADDFGFDHTLNWYPDGHIEDNKSF